MVRKNYPFNERSDKKMNKLISGFITGLLLLPFVILNSDNKKSSKKESTGKTEIVVITIGIGIIGLYVFGGLILELITSGETILCLVALSLFILFGIAFIIHLKKILKKKGE